MSAALLVQGCSAGGSTTGAEGSSKSKSESKSESEPTAVVTVTETVTASPTVTKTPESPRQAPASSAPPPRRQPEARSTPSDSPGRHDGSNYDNLSPEGREAHDTLNCAEVPGHKKGSCNEPRRKCDLAGADVVSSAGIRLTCRRADDGKLRWLP
ncbi:hypothetical protein [Streptomyces sp. CC224B]|uniref:hypothetical protein n=1 Tax=Streptomyces sp. CC224B TaxID=3044571 RepID=UPI0024A81795|nr:hypothetical protein [Streptomyces sp. CC224B]